jgi:hypothetical protein
MKNVPQDRSRGHTRRRKSGGFCHAKSDSGTLSRLPTCIDERTRVTRTLCTLAVIAAALVAVSCTPAHQTPSTPPGPAIQSEALMTHHANGTFDVKLKPQDLHQKVEGASGSLGRMSIDKQFHGGIEGTSVGEMLTAFGGEKVKGSAGYVAVERVTGTVDGKKGSFILQHNSTMSRGVPQQSIVVVPDSGTDELAGISGTFTITIVGGRHEYDFAYTIAR